MRLSDLHFGGDLKRQYRPMVRVLYDPDGWRARMEIVTIRRERPRAASFWVRLAGRTEDELLDDAEIELVAG